MRIVCDQCQASYLVPDEKIVKSVVRLQCQCCGHQILVRIDASPSADEASEKLERWRSSAVLAPVSATRELAEWYYSFNGQSYGPFTKADLLEKFRDGSAPELSFVWHKDLVEWKPALEVEPFSTALRVPPPPPPPPPRAPLPSRSALPPLLRAQKREEEPATNKREPGARLLGLKNRLEQTPSTQFEAIKEQPLGLDALVRAAATAEESQGSRAAELADSLSLPEIDVDMSAEMDSEEYQSEAGAFAGKALEDVQLELESDESSALLTQSDLPQGDLSAIDLDESTQLYSQDEIEAIQRSSSDGLSSREMSLSSQELGRVVFGENQEVARVSARQKPVSGTNFESLRAKHSNLFEAAQLLERKEADYSSQPGEQSMMLQIAHLQKAQNKQNRRLLILGLSLLSVILIAGLVFIFYPRDEENEQAVFVDRSLSSVQGSYIDEQELSRYAPSDDFEILTKVSPEPVKQAQDDAKSPKSEKIQGGAIEANGAQENGAIAKASEGSSDTGAGLGSVPALQPSLGRRDSVLVLPKTAPSNDTHLLVQGSKYAGLKRPGQSDRLAFASGLKSVSRTVQECHKRELKMGQVAVAKIYINIVVNPDGTVSRFSVDTAGISQNFVNCLEAKKDRWVFQAFEGEAIELRQGFVLE